MQKRVAALIVDLDSSQFATRQAAEQALIGMGRPALTAVDEAAHSGSPEVVFRARRILKQVQHSMLYASFNRLARRENLNVIDIEEGLLLVSELVQPGCDRDAARQELDALALAVRKRMEQAGHDPDLRKVDPQKSIAVLCEVIFSDAGFHGAATAYDQPKSSSLTEVLKNRQGLPILLSEVVALVGYRLNLPIVGISLPRRFMVKYDGRRAPAGFPQDDIIFDPFDGGKVLSQEEVRQVLAQLGANFTPETDLVPATGRGVLVRVLTNLRNDYLQVGDLYKARQVELYRALLDDQLPR